MPCLVSWSGGKDSCLALWRARRQGADVRYLVTTYSPATGRTMAHGLPLDLLRAQARALDLELVPVPAEWEDYEARFREALRALRKRGAEACIFGDIDLPEHREWVERVTREAELRAWLPLWGEAQPALLQEWWAEGFQAIIVAVRSDALGLDWLGRPLDQEAVSEMGNLLQARGLSPCGEGGEYHTLVLGGPLFRQRLEITEAVPVLCQRHWLLDIKSFALKPASLGETGG